MSEPVRLLHPQSEPKSIQGEQQEETAAQYMNEVEVEKYVGSASPRRSHLSGTRPTRLPDHSRGRTTLRRRQRVRSAHPSCALPELQSGRQRRRVGRAAPQRRRHPRRTSERHPGLQRPRTERRALPRPVWARPDDAQDGEEHGRHRRTQRAQLQGYSPGDPRGAETREALSI
jgi:hypothetical protein